MGDRDEQAIVEAKRELRAEAKARRARMPIADRISAAGSIASHGLSFLDRQPPAIVSGFLAMGEELDPVPLLQALRRQGYEIALPAMVGKAKPLAFRKWLPGDPLRTVMWGIREPLDTAPVVEPDVLLVPLLAFDRRGWRLGYGGGFYDRSIALLRSRKPLVTVGLAFAGQEVDAVPHLDYDQRLDWVLTSEGPIRCIS